MSAEAAGILDEFVNVRGDFYTPLPLAAMVERLALALGVELRGDWRNFAVDPEAYGFIADSPSGASTKGSGDSNE